MKIKVGITGQSGFIGTHLFNFLSLKSNIQLINFNRDYFGQQEKLATFVSDCDVIVHLAALNRHTDQSLLFSTNIRLIKQLIKACEKSASNPWIIFSSSTQEDNENEYGVSKREGRQLLESWASENDGRTSGLVIPNVFGPFGKPNYNSVFATFCHQVVNDIKPQIKIDGELQLIYINELIDDIYQIISEGKIGKINIQARHQIKVSELLEKIQRYYKHYKENGQFPSLRNSTDLAIFNSLICYLPQDFYPRKLVLNKDERGAFVEVAKTNTSGQFSYSTTVSGITRGNHFHTRKAERFAVIKGKALIQLRKINTSEIIEYTLDGGSPSYVDMPIWHIHNIKNIGKEELITLFWINEPYNPDDSDTYFEVV